MKRARLLNLSLLLACQGSETGNPVANDGKGGENTDKGCEVASSTRVPFAQQTSLGFAAADVLAYAAGARREALRWQTLRFASYGPEQGEQTLDLTITPVGSTAALVDYQRKQAGIELAADCAGQLEIDVDVRLVSGGGALDETLRSKLIARRAEVAILAASLDPAKLTGSLTVSAAELGAGWQTRSLQLGVQATRYARSGSLSASFEMRSGDSVGESSGAGPLAVFGLEPCADGIAVPLDASGSASSAAALALARQHDSATLTQGASQQRVTLAFEPGGSACQLFADSFGVFNGPGVLVPGTLAVNTADGAIAGRWPMVLRSQPDAAGALQAPLSLELDPYSQPAGDTLAERFGFTRLDVSGYDSTSLLPTLSLALDGSWSGSWVVYGFVNPVCPAPQPGSSSSPGCPGAERTEVARYELR